ncbi:MAG: diguanylate cyclase, partial [Candidatus Competibacterales bacterium]|nr:diguanylate cyclase [Candidatus Competibacterales bacterium]
AYAGLFDHDKAAATGRCFADLVRHVHRTRRGLNVETDDVDAWLKKAKRLRRSSQYRAFETDTCDGRWFLLTEQIISEGNLFVYFTEITGKKRAETRLLQLSNELKVLAEIDSLTGLSNRRHFMSQVQQEVARSQRLRRPLALLVLDVDLFKQVNDRYGHQAGDQALQAIAQTMRRVTRPYDFVGRIGGEEFAVLLPEATPGEARRAAERLRQEVEAIDGNALVPGLQLTLSVGLACVEHATEATTLDLLMGRADHALYEAKRAGRNCVVCYTGDQTNL